MHFEQALLKLNFKSIKKIRKILFYVILSVVLLPFFLIALIQINFIQNYLCRQCASYLSKELNTEVKVGYINFTFLFDLILEDVVIKDLHKNPILDAKSLIVSINDISFKRGLISVHNIKLKKAKINLVKYKNEKQMNFQFIADYFTSSDTVKKENEGFKIIINSLKLIDNNFRYHDENVEQKAQGIDFDNINISGLNARINKFKLIDDTITADIRTLSLKDKSGFCLNSFSSEVKICPQSIFAHNLHIETDSTCLSMNLSFNYNGYDGFEDFVNKVKIDALFKPSRINMSDIGYFSSEFFGMNNIINVSGELKGKISNLKGKNFHLLYGKSTYFLGNFNISGLPDIEETYIHLNVKNFYLSIHDVQSFKYPTTKGMQQLKVPEEVVRLGSLRFKGAFTGFYNDFVAYGDFYTNLGKISTDITLRKNRKNKELEYTGKIKTNNFNAGKLFDIKEQLGTISMNADITGSGFDPEKANIKIKGNIASIDVRNYTYKNIKIEGDLGSKKFNGFMKIDDENIKMDFSGLIDYRDKEPVFDVESKITDLRFSKLHIMQLAGDSLSSFSTKIKLNFKGSTIDNIQGTIKAKNTSYIYKGERYLLDNFVFSNTAMENGDKTLEITSDYLNADISGNFMFKDLYFSSLKFIKDYLPSFGTWIKENTDSILSQNFTFLIKLKNPSPLCKLFIPELTVSTNTIVKGSYNTNKSMLDLNVTSAFVQYNSYVIKDFFLNSNTKDSKININIGSEQVNISDSLGIDNLVFNGFLKNDSIIYKLNWENNNDEVKNSGNVSGIFTFFQRPKMELKLTEARFVINDTSWIIDKGNSVLIDSNSVAISDMVFSSKSQHLKIFGNISENPADRLHVNFKDFNISELDMLTSQSGFDFDGYLNGYIDVSNIYKSFNVLSNLTIKDFYINNDKFGKAILITTWDNQKKAANINFDILYEGTSGTSTPISITGNFYPESKTDNFDLTLNLTNFKLKLIEKYLSGFSSNLKGYATGKLKLKGAINEPELSGHVYAIVKGIKIDYLNENYSFTDSIFVDKNSFSFKHIILNDSYGDTAICNGKIMHNNFYDFNLDLIFRPYNFHCLNTDITQNNLFYGKAYISGLVKITGEVDNIKIDVSAKTEKNTHFFIPISDVSEITDNDYIKFVNNKFENSLDESYNVDLSGIVLSFGLDVTPDADVQIIFDSKIGDIIKARGNGNIKMEITTLGDFNMYGDYVIEQGDYLFTLKNVINKKFIVQKGSSIKWNGNPYDGIADITAIYPVKTALFDLVQEQDTSEIYKKRTEVDCMLGMKDKIFNPAVTFDISLPNSDENTKTLVKSIINNEEEMNRQIFSLLILNSFTSPGRISYSNISSGLGSTSTELLSNQLSNWLSQINKNFDIGVNYRPGTQMTSEEIEVALSTQLFNDRLSIDGNVGVSGNQGNASKASNIVGDVNLEYKITNDGRFKIKGFNKSNTVDLLNINSPYTQGLGVFYRREFDFLGELFHGNKQ